MLIYSKEEITQIENYNKKAIGKIQIHITFACTSCSNRLSYENPLLFSNRFNSLSWLAKLI